MSQLVDPFSPVRSSDLRTLRPIRQPARPHSKVNSPALAPVNHLGQGTLSEQEPYQTALTTTYKVNYAAEKKHDINHKSALSKIGIVVRLPLFIILVLAFSYLLQSLIVGGIVIGLYAIYVFVKHVPSKISFQLAIVAIIGIITLIGLGNDAQLVSNFTIYSLLLIIIGTLSLSGEQK